MHVLFFLMLSLPPLPALVGDDYVAKLIVFFFSLCLLACLILFFVDKFFFWAAIGLMMDYEERRRGLRSISVCSILYVGTYYNR